MRISRRTLALPFISLLLLLFANIASAVSDTYGGVLFHPYTMDPNNDTCVPWTENGTATRNCDPVNLIFPEQTVIDVHAELAGKGWSTSGFGSDQLLHFADENIFLTQNLQLYWNENISSRYHIRLWQAPGNILMTLGAVHHESGFIVHTIDRSWEDSEVFVAGLLCGGGFTCDETGLLFEQYDNIQGGAPVWRNWENNGSATVIRPFSGPGPTPPMAINDTYTTGEDSTLNVSNPGVLANDSDADGDSLTTTLVLGPANGNLTLNSDGSFTYTPNANFDDSDSFTYTANDGTADSNEATVAINITSVNDSPVASFTYYCINLYCTFDASSSSDVDSSLTSYDWNFGDGITGSGINPDHTYAVASTYTVNLTVSDGELNDSESQAVTASETDPTAMHIGDLDGGSDNQGKNWIALVMITIHDASENLVADATVTGRWSGTSGQITCTTDALGTCRVISDIIPKKTAGVDFSIDDVTHKTMSYTGGDNHDPDGDSNGSTITITKDSPPPPPPPGATTDHVGDLDGTTKAIGKNKWKATVTITVLDNNDNPVANATVTGQWSGGYNGTASCLTGSGGQCSMSTANMDGSAGSVTFTISEVNHSLSYEPADNHDPDGDSDGSSIIIY